MFGYGSGTRPAGGDGGERQMPGNAPIDLPLAPCKLPLARSRIPHSPRGRSACLRPNATSDFGSQMDSHIGAWPVNGLIEGNSSGLAVWLYLNLPQD